MKKLFLGIVTLVVLATLCACGGGGGSSANGLSSASASGAVMDGYLKNAFVFLDLNNDGVHNLGEPQTTTDANGRYTLSAAASDLTDHSIIAVAIAGSTVDQDTPDVTVNQQYSLTAPAGKNSVISPITTLIASKVSLGLSIADAESSVKTDLGLANVDLYKDYIEAKVTDSNYQQVHNIASATVEILKIVESTSGSIKSSKEKLILVSNEIKSSDFNENLTAIKNSSTNTKAASIGSVSSGTSLSQKFKNIIDQITSITATILLVM